MIHKLPEFINIYSLTRNEYSDIMPHYNAWLKNIHAVCWSINGVGCLDHIIVVSEYVINLATWIWRGTESGRITGIDHLVNIPNVGRGEFLARLRKTAVERAQIIDLFAKLLPQPIMEEITLQYDSGERIINALIAK